MLSVSGISVRYASELGTTAVLDCFSGEFQGGKIYVIMGRNGCGKSTLLKAIVQEISLMDGEVGFRCMSATHERTMEYLPQDYRQAIFPWKTVEENVYPWNNGYSTGFGGDATGSLNDAIKKVLHEFGLADVAEVYPYKLSGGQLQLLLLARSVVSPARVILLDEPFSALDIVRRSVVAEHLRQDWRDKGKVVVCAMHEPEEAVTLADEVIFFSGTPMVTAGRIERSDSLETTHEFRDRVVEMIHNVAAQGGYDA